MKGDEVLTVKHSMPKVMAVIGELDFVGYTTVRDGEEEKYIHRFKNSSRPLLTASPDGSKLGIIGGRFQFKETGINDI